MRKIIYCFLLFLWACNNGKQSTPEADFNGIYLDYKISGEEGYDKLTILARFRDGGKNEETVLLKEPAKIELDGEVFPEETTPLSGPFYELNKPIIDFNGKHTLRFTNFNNKVQEETFIFEPMILRSEVPEVMHRGDLYFDLGGIDEKDQIRVIMTDTSFINEGVNKLDSVKSGRVVLTSTDLENLANGPVQLELIKESERPIVIGDEKRGRLRIFYVMRRSFILED